MTTRLSVNIADSTAAALQALSDKHGTSLTETVRRAISVYAGVAEQWDAHRKVLVQDGDVLYELTFEEDLGVVPLHAAKPAQDCAPGAAAPRYIVEQDGRTFYVVDTAADVILMSTPAEVDAGRAAGQLNAGQPLDLYPDEDDDEC